MKVRTFWRLLILLILAGCGEGRPGTPESGTIVSAPPQPTTGSLPATFTPPASAVPLPTTTPRATSTPDPTSPPVNFDQTAVELRYTIPALGLDRRLQGNIASQIILVDETTGEARQFNNQASILLELQQALPDLALEAVPEDCETCVRVTYNLPLSAVSGAGWLQDSVLLASIENFMSLRLGPHFPPGTQLGLRRSASPYAPAHTLALTADGRLWRWLATDTRIPDPVDVAAAPDLLPLLASLSPADLETQYTVDCIGSPTETLLLDENSPPIRLLCPEFSLPSTLLPLYLEVDRLLTPTITGVALPRPPAALPLDALVDYRRADQARLTLFLDGRVTAVDATTTYTGTLTTTQVLSLTTSLLDSGLLQPGLTSFQPTATPTGTTAVTPVLYSQLLVRGPDGVHDGRWPGIPDLADLNALLDSLLVQPAILPAEPEPTPTP